MSKRSDEELAVLAELMPTHEELVLLRGAPLGTDAAVDALRMHRLEQILEQQSGVLATVDEATLRALVVAWSDAQPSTPSPVAKPGGPVDPVASVREAMADHPDLLQHVQRNKNGR